VGREVIMKIASILKVAPLGLVAFLLLASNGSAAPDEESLGKAEGYPVCPGLAPAAGAIGSPGIGEMMALWSGVVSALGK
jgi:hypothetical protein